MLLPTCKILVQSYSQITKIYKVAHHAHIYDILMKVWENKECKIFSVESWSGKRV